MHILGRVPSEALVKINVFWRGGQPLFPANDMGDAHEMVVHHHREVISRKTIGFDEHLIIEIRGVNRHIAAHSVAESDLFVVGKF